MGELSCESIPISLQTYKINESFQDNHSSKISTISKMRVFHIFWLKKVEGFFRQRYKKVEGEGVNLRDIMCCKIITRTVSHNEVYHKKIQMQRTEQIKMVGEKIAC